MNHVLSIDMDSLDADGNVTVRPEDLPTAPLPSCPPFCTQHFPDADNGAGYCYSDALDGVGVTYDQEIGAAVFIHELPDGGATLTPANARKFAAALLAQAERAEQALAAFTFPATR